MTLTASQKAYRTRPEEREKRRIYALEQRRRPSAMTADAQRKRRERSTPHGAQLNRDRVKANRAALGRSYISQLLHDETGIACRAVPDRIITMKREQIILRRVANELLQAINDHKELDHETHHRHT